MLDRATSYEDLVRRLKEIHCPSCELNLFCAAGRSGGRSFWCRTCRGYYVPGLRRIVQCSGFPAAQPRFRWVYSKSDVAFTRAWREDVSVARCPVCEGIANDQLRALRHFMHNPVEGFIAEDTENTR